MKLYENTLGLSQNDAWWETVLVAVSDEGDNSIKKNVCSVLKQMKKDQRLEKNRARKTKWRIFLSIFKDSEKGGIATSSDILITIL